MVDTSDIKNYINKQIIAATKYKQGISRQMELFKSACAGTGDNNWDLMCDSIENIKSDIKDKMISDNWDKELVRIEKIINWYRTIEINEKYIINTPDGKIFQLPANLKFKINKNLRIAYELLVRVMNKMGMLG